MVLGRFLTKFLKYFAFFWIVCLVFVLDSCTVLSSQPIRVITAFDQSESARNDAEYNTALQLVCRTQSETSQDGDKLLTMLFAEETQISDTFAINNRLDALQICQRQVKQMEKLQIGKSPGTSIHKAIARIELQIDRMNQQAEPLPTAVIVVIHANETGDTLEAFNTTAAKLAQMTQKQVVVSIVVANAELHRLLDAALQDSSVQICPATSANDCVQWGYQTAREMSQI